MLNRRLLNRILRDESLVRGLADPEARVMIEWLVDRAEQGAKGETEEHMAEVVQRLCRRARSISRFVFLWCHLRARGPATQLAAVERFCWPLPSGNVDPCMLMQDILNWEDESEGPLAA